MGNLTHTVSGDIASFRSAARAPIESLKCHFLPKQDLHGYDRPWPGGGGKNLLPTTAVTTVTNYGITFTVNSDGSIHANGTATLSTWLTISTITLPAGSYYVSGGINGNCYINIPSIVNSYGPDASFTLAEKTTISPRVYVSTNQVIDDTFYPMIRLSSNSNSTWEPYENICPIEGWNQCKIYQSGINIFDEIYEDGGLNSVGVNSTSDSFIRSKNYIPCIPGQTYCFSYTHAEPYSSNIRVYFYDQNQTYLTDIWVTPYQKKAIHSKACYMRFYVDSAYKKAGIKDVSINYPATDTQYHHYIGQNQSIIFPTTGKNKLNPNDIIVSNNFELVNNIYQNTNTDTRDSCQLAVQLWKSTGTYIKTAITVSNVAIGRFSATFNVDEKNCKYICFKYNGKTRDFILLFPLRLGLRQYTISCDVLSNDPTTIGGVQLTNIQLEVGDTATEYEPYVDNLDNTIYGGYVDIAKGEIVKEYDSYTFTGIPEDQFTYTSTQTYSYDERAERHVFHTKILDNILARNSSLEAYSNIANPNIYNIGRIGDIIFYIGTPSKQFSLAIDSSLCEPTIESFNAWLANNPVQLVYKLANPIHYPLSKTELKTFLDQNNIWSNTNDITEALYQIHDSNMIQTIRKQIAGNEPHIEVVSNTLTNFTTNKITPLKECTIHFSPIQEGNGDPSPDNIRPIIGHTSLKLFQYGENKCVPTPGGNTTSNGLTWKVENNGVVSFEGTPTAFSGKEAGKYYIDSTAPIHATIIGEDISNMRFDTARFFSNSQQIGEIQSGWEGPMPPVSADPSSFPTAEYLKIILKRYNNNITMKGKCIPIVNTILPTINTYDISWETNLGTIYGGYIDIVRGKLVQTHKSVIFDGSESGWDTYASTRQMTFHRKIADKKIGLGTSIASNFPNVKNTYFWDRELYTQYGDHNTLDRIYVNAPYKMPNLITEWRAWLAENPMQLVYELAVPIEYDISPIIIKTLLGINNFWSTNNELIEIKYWTH